MRTLITILALAFSAQLIAQKPFTLKSELEKQRKYYPNIQPFQPDSSNVVSLKNVLYRQVGDRDLTVDIYMPKDTAGKRFMPILIVHGGGWRSGSKDLDHPMAIALASKGFAAVCVDYRKSSEALYPAAVVDVSCAVRWARSEGAKYHIDTTKIALAGSSAGGQLASLVGSVAGHEPSFLSEEYGEFSSRVDYVVDIDGVLAFIHPDSQEGVKTPGKTSSAALWFGGEVEEKRGLYEEASALNHVCDESADFLFINSAQKRFSAGQAEMIEALKEHGHSATERKTQDTPHTFWLFDPWAPDVVEWIAEWLASR